MHNDFSPKINSFVENIAIVAMGDGVSLVSRAEPIYDG